jgi:hypothetical protein
MNWTSEVSVRCRMDELYYKYASSAVYRWVECRNRPFGSVGVLGLELVVVSPSERLWDRDGPVTRCNMCEMSNMVQMNGSMHCSG